MPMVLLEPPRPPAELPPVPSATLALPLPAVAPPTPRVDAEPPRLPADEPPVPSAVLALPLPVEEPPELTVEELCAIATPANSVAAAAVIRNLFMG